MVFPTPSEGDPAFWQPDAQAVATFQQADLILLNGAGYTLWVNRLRPMMQYPASVGEASATTATDQPVTAKPVTATPDETDFGNENTEDAGIVVDLRPASEVEGAHIDADEVNITDS